MKISRRKFLKSLALAGAIATMGISGCVEPEPTPAPNPTRKPPATPMPEPNHTPAPATTPTPTPTTANDPTPTKTSTPPPSPTPATTPTPTPTPTPEPTNTPTISPRDDDYYVTLVKTTLAMEDINVTSAHIVIGWGGGGYGKDKSLILAYESDASTKEELAVEIGNVTHTFVDTVRDGWNIDAIQIAVGDEGGNITGTWYCDGNWVRDYLDGTISREILYNKIISTFIKSLSCHVRLTDLKDENCHLFEDVVVF